MFLTALIALFLAYIGWRIFKFFFIQLPVFIIEWAFKAAFALLLLKALASFL
jgi:hypothetical protein